MKITANIFKKKYLYFDSSQLGKKLVDLVNNNDRNILIKNIFKIFPYMCTKDLQTILIYLNSTIIEYSNRINIKLNKILFDNYVEKLADDKIIVDVKRLSYSKKFVKYFKSEVKKICDFEMINLEDLDYFEEDRLEFFKIDGINNSEKFIHNILESNRYIRYLMHQDIHNSIINPLINFIMIRNYISKGGNKNFLIQLMEIRQIYKAISNDTIDLLYFTDKVMFFDYQTNESPKKYEILQKLVIKCEIKVLDDSISIYLTF